MVGEKKEKDRMIETKRSDPSFVYRLELCLFP